jgi:23S rRNA (pseudouridine1915-N3)-methyltransferase
VNIVVVTGEGRAPAWATAACEEWERRISRTFPLRFETVAPRVSPRERLVLLDERGEERNSEGFAALLEEAVRNAANPLIFAIGGPYGHDEATRARAWKTLRLSCMVLNHAVARIVLVEQIYRGVQIRLGTPYHHGG